MATIIPGRRGGKVLVFEGYLYQRNKVRENVIYWRCSECRSTIQTAFFDVNDPPEEIVVQNFTPHDHPAMDEIINRQHITSQIKADVETNPSAPIKRVYDAAIANEERHGNPIPIDDIPTFHCIESQLKRAKYANVPEIPHNVDDVVIDGVWSQTWQGRNNLIHQDNDWGILIFGTNRNLRLLQGQDIIYADGTFRTCPHPYNEMFTIHVQINGHVLCTITCLMLNKDIGSYREILRVLKETIRNVTGRRWAPTVVVVDFEQASIAAFQTEFPNISVKGCYFHYNQSLWRAVQRLGLVNAYRNNRLLKKCVKNIMSLGFLPLAVVRLNFNALSVSRRTRRLFNRFPALREFFDYFRRNYLDGNFPPCTWNVFTRTMDIHTNNSVESYHSRWNQAVGVRHPSIWKFIRVLKDQQSVNNVTNRAIRNGDDAPRRKRKWRVLEDRINTQKRLYNQGEIDISNYWRAVSHLTLDN